MLRVFKDVLQAREGDTTVPDTVQSFLKSLGHRILAVPHRLHEEMFSSVMATIERYRQRDERAARGVEEKAVKGTQTTPARPHHTTHVLPQPSPSQPALYQSFLAPSPSHLFPPSSPRASYTTLTTVRRQTPVQGANNISLSPMIGAYLGDFGAQTPGSSFGQPPTPGSSLTTPPITAPTAEYTLPSGLGHEEID